MRRTLPLIIFFAIAALVFGMIRGANETSFSAKPPSDRAPERYPAQENPTDAGGIENTTDDATKSGALWPAAGERWLYRFERKAMATYQGKVWLKLAIGGRASIEKTSSDSRSARYVLTPEIDRLEMQGESQQETRRLPAIQFELGADGRVRELRYATWSGHVVGEEDRDLLQDIASQWLFFESRTRLGPAEVRWSRPPMRGSLRTIAKKITRYLDRPEITNLDSQHEWTTLIDQGRMDRLEGNESFSLDSGNGSFDQQTSYRWLWTGTEKATGLAGLVVGETFDVVAKAGRNENQSPVPDGPTIARAWSEISGMQPQIRLRFFRDAKRFLDLDANSGATARAVISLIVRDLRGKAPTSVEWRTGVGLLAATSNPEAQAALHSLYTDASRNSDEKVSILAGVAAGEGAPAPEWKATLERQIANDPDVAVREAALYALGSAIRKEADQTKRGELEGVLWSEIRGARSESAQLVVLDAIGNSGSTEYAAYLREQTESPSVRVRTKAALAARFLAAESAKPILERARVDPNSAVRQAAQQSAAYQAAQSSADAVATPTDSN